MSAEGESPEEIQPFEAPKDGSLVIPEDFRTKEVEELVAKAQSGDPEALNSLFQRYYARMVAQARRRLGARLRTKEEADDLAQTTFREATRDFQRYTYRGEGSLLRWLVQILQNKIRDWHRRQMVRNRVMVWFGQGARAGEGPHLIEALTYRLADHTTSDNASRYRDDDDVTRHWQEDPIARLRSYLEAHHAWSRDDEEATLASCAEEVQAAVETYLDTPPAPVGTAFDFMFETLPADLARQRDLATGSKDDG